MQRSHRLQEAGLRCFTNPPKDNDYVNKAFLCLAFIRNIVQLGYEIDKDTFYTKVVRWQDRVERVNGEPSYWIARDAERSAREQKWGIWEGSPEPGELLFWYRTAKNKYGIYEGHILMYLGVLPLFIDDKWQLKRVCIENAKPEWRIKDGSYLANNGCVVLVDLDKIPNLSMRARLPEVL
jgi:hypothetical protein